jgi:hypothetical protein
MTSHCCEAMTCQVNWHCDTHPDRYDCPDVLISFVARYREYGLIVHDGGSSYIVIGHCPWCGARLPRSQRDRWHGELELRGIDPITDVIPAEFQDDQWVQSLPEVNAGLLRVLDWPRAPS